MLTQFKCKLMVSIKFFMSKGFGINPSASHIANASPWSACAENKSIGRLVCICLKLFTNFSTQFAG
jgi:hypothetical protein